MYSSVFLVALHCFLLFSISSATHHHAQHSPPHFSQSSTASVPPLISQACASTRYPEACVSSLVASNRVPPDPTPLDLVQSALWVSFDHLSTAQSMMKDILNASAGNPNRTRVATACLDGLHNSDYRISSTIDDAIPRRKMKDARAWMSAALQYQSGCLSGLTNVNDTQQVNNTISFLSSLVGMSSNGLSILASYDIFRDDIGSWRPPKTERDGYWEPTTGSDPESEVGFEGGVVPTQLPPNATVCKTGQGCYTRVQEAVDAAPANISDGKFMIRIREGVYQETVRVPLEKQNIVFLGDGIGKTVITGSLNAGQPGMTTYDSATVAVNGDRFMASGITFQNTAGPETHQAVAFRSDSDLSVIENCEFLGNQDTLYAHSLRQFYKSCNIQGNVDFIFGNSAAVFQDCLIQVRPRQLDPQKGESNAVTAQARADPAQTTGFVFQNCSVNGTGEYMKLYYSNPRVHKNFLGRPWREYSRTVFIGCSLEALVTADGWMPWSGDFALKTLYYGEFQNSGLGANLTARVKWSGQIPAEHMDSYSLKNFIQGDEWIPHGQGGREG